MQLFKLFLFIVGVVFINNNQSNGQLLDGDDLDKDIDNLFNNLNDSTSTTRQGIIMCVPYHLCDGETKKIVSEPQKDGSFVIDIRFSKRKCQHYLDVPCEVPAGYIISTSPQPPIVTQPPVNPPVNPPIEPPITSPPIVTEIPVIMPPVNPPSQTGQCGVRHNRGVGVLQITGAEDGESQFGEFPWVVAVLKKNFIPSSEDTLAQCGGALIHPQVVLTAAHCTHDHFASELKIRAGEWDTQTTKEQFPFQERDVEQIIRHEGFNPVTLFNDIALLVLKIPVDPANHISTICLPAQGQLFEQNNCIVNGWGKDVFGDRGRYQVILKKIELSMVNRIQCQSALRKTRLGNRFDLDQSFVCAGGENGKDACRGDGGGALVCPGNDGRYLQAGIVAWGIGCGTPGVPGVYADVSQFRQWIDERMQKLNFGSSSYTY